jgi:L-threonylcarbamoyladenylate synthase
LDELVIRVADEHTVAEAAAALRSGRLVAFPTETVYGLGADATDAAALAAVFALKGRPADHPLIVHLAAADELRRWARRVPEDAERLAAAFWPGPLTIVVERAAGISPVASGGRDTIGLRVPDHPVALALLRATGRPVAAPSANRFGRVSPTTATDVATEFAGAIGTAAGVATAEFDGAVDGSVLWGVLDGGPCRIGVESTIVELVGPRPVLLRPGGVPAEAIEAVLGTSLAAPTGAARAPGMLASHYAPAVAVELVDQAGGADHSALRERLAGHRAAGRRVALLGVVGSAADVEGEGIVRLGPVGDTDGYARLLYRRLREADDAGVDVLVAVLPPAAGLGRAVHDRLSKAAAPRP